MHLSKGTALNAGERVCGYCLGSSFPTQALTVLLVGCQLLKQVCPVLLLLLHLRRRGVSLSLSLLQRCSRETSERKTTPPGVRLLSPCCADVHASSNHALTDCQHAHTRTLLLPAKQAAAPVRPAALHSAQLLHPEKTNRSSVAHLSGPGSATWRSHSHWQGCGPAASAPALHRQGRLVRQAHAGQHKSPSLRWAPPDLVNNNRAQVVV